MVDNDIEVNDTINSFLNRVIFFQCANCREGDLLTIKSIFKHHKSITIHKGRTDLVVYKIENKLNKDDTDFYTDYPTLKELLNKGKCNHRSGALFILIPKQNETV